MKASIIFPLEHGTHYGVYLFNFKLKQHHVPRLRQGANAKENEGFILAPLFIKREFIYHLFISFYDLRSFRSSGRIMMGTLQELAQYCAELSERDWKDTLSCSTHPLFRKYVAYSSDVGPHLSNGRIGGGTCSMETYHFAQVASSEQFDFMGYLVSCSESRAVQYILSVLKEENVWRNDVQEMERTARTTQERRAVSDFRKKFPFLDSSIDEKVS